MLDVLHRPPCTLISQAIQERCHAEHFQRLSADLVLHCFLNQGTIQNWKVSSPTVRETQNTSSAQTHQEIVISFPHSLNLVPTTGTPWLDKKHKVHFVPSKTLLSYSRWITQSDRCHQTTWYGQPLLFVFSCLESLMAFWRAWQVSTTHSGLILWLPHPFRNCKWIWAGCHNQVSKQVYSYAEHCRFTDEQAVIENWQWLGGIRSDLVVEREDVANRFESNNSRHVLLSRKYAGTNGQDVRYITLIPPADCISFSFTQSVLKFWVSIFKNVRVDGGYHYWWWQNILLTFPNGRVLNEQRPSPQAASTTTTTTTTTTTQAPTTTTADGEYPPKPILHQPVFKYSVAPMINENKEPVAES